MPTFIELTQMGPGIGPLTINLEKVVLFAPSANAGGGTDIIVENGKVTYDAEEGYRSYTVSFRVKESYQSVKAAVGGLRAGK